MTTTIARRVSRLEDAAGVKDELHHVVCIIKTDPNETVDAAVERYRAKHPDVPGNTLFIVRVIVSPQRRGVMP